MIDMHGETAKAAAEKDVEAWDVPTRVFHWSIVILIALAWWSAEERLLDWHRRAGYAILCLLIFRILWGFAGTRSARFASFCKTPAQVVRYVRSDMFSRSSATTIGHNPLGGWSVVAMLATMLLQTFLGLFAVDVDGIESGPLSYLVSFDVGRIAAQVHHCVFNALLCLIGLHMAAILFHQLYKKQNLTQRMITGRYTTDESSTLFSWPLRSSALFIWSVLFVLFLINIIGR
jgi:cytochrome b